MIKEQEKSLLLEETHNDKVAHKQSFKSIGI